MIHTVGELRAALKDYDDATSIILVSQGGALATQMFPIASVGHTPSEVCINVGPEYSDEAIAERRG